MSFPINSARIFPILGVSFILTSLFPNLLQAQRPDAPNASDHPLISRFEGFYIGKYQEVEFDQYELPLGPAEKGSFSESKTLEGRVTKISYQMVDGTRPSLFQMVKNFETALGAKNAELLYACQKAECGAGNDDIITQVVIRKNMLNEYMRFGQHAFQAYRFSYEGKAYYAALFFREEKNQVAYELHVVELEEMALDKVNVANIAASIEETGKIAFYGIYFDFGKATIQAESAEALQTMADFLKENPDKEFFIVGHTDNVGDYNTNLNLSTQRAEAVANELKSKYGLSGAKLTTVGVGPVSPVASNQNDEGRAMNRRVELVIR